MMLCIDAGNTRIKAGAWTGNAWAWRTAIEPAALTAWFGALPTPTRICACNVAGAAIAGQIDALAAARKVPLAWLAASTTACGVQNAYRQPDTLGADRWAALIAARGMQMASNGDAGVGATRNRALLVVMAGTATTVDALAGNGRFLGGFILPGLALMRSSLAHGTAQLPLAQAGAQSAHDANWATSTGMAIVGGSIEATLGAIERAQRRLGGDAVCVLSGGAADELAPHLVGGPGAVVRAPDLVLDGLRRWGAQA